MLRASGGGRTVLLGEQVVAPGDGRVVLWVEPPPGHYFDPAAPFEARVRVRTTPDVAASAEGPLSARIPGPGVQDQPAGTSSMAIHLDPERRSWIRERPVFPCEIPVRFAPGTGDLDIDLVAYYCEERGGGVCYYQHVCLMVNIVVKEEGAGTDLEIAYRLGTPEIAPTM